MERFLSIADKVTGKLQPVVTAHGVNYDAVFSPDGTKTRLFALRPRLSN